MGKGAIRQRRDILRTIFAYALFSALWIVFSDHVLALLVRDPVGLTVASVAKGWIFVAVTSFLLYLLLCRQFAVVARLNADLGATLDAIPDLFFEVDADGVYQNVWVDSPRWLGKAVVQQGHNICEFLLHDAAETVRASIGEAAAAGRSSGKVISVDSVDGVRWYEVSVAKKTKFTGGTIRFVIFLNDITARTESENALRESEKRFRNLFEMNTSVILVIEPGSGEIVDANAAAASFYGYPREHLVGMSIDSINTLPPEQIAEERARARRGERTIFHFPHRLASGDIRQVEVHLTPIESNGRILLFSIVSDITARTEAEERLRASEERLRLSLEAARDGLWDWDLRSGVVYRSEQYFDVIGSAPGPDRGDFALFKSTVHADDWPRMQAAIEAHQRGETEMIDVTYRFAGGNGETKWLQTIGRVVERDANGAPLRMVGILCDITGRKRAEAELGKLSSAIEQSPESIVITDLDGTIEYVNDAFVRNSGYPRVEAIGQNPRVLNSGKTPRETFVAMWAALTSGEPWRGEFHNRRKDGSEYFESAVIAPLRAPDGKATHYVAVKEDITERKRLQAELQQGRGVADAV